MGAHQPRAGTTSSGWPVICSAMSASTARVPAPTRPVARVLPLLGLSPLDRLFDYKVDATQDDAAQPGTRIRVYFSGRLTDALIIARGDTTDYPGELAWIKNVISPEVVYPPQMRRLTDALCDRYAGIRSDIIRAAIPSRHARAEESDTTTPWDELGDVEEPDLSAWSAYQHGESFVDAVIGGTTARAAWQILPGDSWADALAALAVKTVMGDGGALIVVPDQRDVDKLEAALRKLVSAKQITVLTASLGPQARYRRFLSVLHGQGRLVIGTRSAAFAPVNNLKLAVILNDGDDSLVDPRAPYVHAREVLTTRSVIEGCSLIMAGHARTPEVQLMVQQGWAHDLVGSRDTIRMRMPRIHAVADTDTALERDPHARTARLPKIAFEAVRRALDADKPVLIQVPRKGYVPVLACGNCVAIARCRHCNGPLGLPTAGSADEAAVPTCRWCGRPDPRHRCNECGSTKLRAIVLGTDRTAEEFGRAFPKVPIELSGGNKILDTVSDGARIIVATPGAEPTVTDGSYGALLLLDTWALLRRPDLRATEDTLHKWAAASSLVAPHHKGGEVVVVAPSGLMPVQALIRWDMVRAAAIELDQRAEVDFPPTVHMAALDGAAASLEKYLGLVELPPNAEILGPVDLPPGVTLPGEYDERRYGPPQRYLIRVPLVESRRYALGKALRAGLVKLYLQRDNLPLRVQVDPLHVG